MSCAHRISGNGKADLTKLARPVREVAGKLIRGIAADPDGMTHTHTHGLRMFSRIHSVGGKPWSFNIYFSLNAGRTVVLIANIDAQPVYELH